MYWKDLAAPGRCLMNRKNVIRTLTAIGYDGPISVEWEDAGMDRLQGAPEALARLRALDFVPQAASFDAAFSKQSEGD